MVAYLDGHTVGVDIVIMIVYVTYITVYIHLNNAI